MIMKKVKITITVNSIYFSFTNQKNTENLNETSYIETGNLIFDHEYINNNQKLMSTFIKDITEQTKINTVKIKNLELVPTIMKIIKSNNLINKLYILDNKIVNIDSFLTIVDNKNINYLNCYNIPSIMFNYINSRRDILIELRNQYDIKSNFLIENKLNNYSNIYYKKIITINKSILEEDLNDLKLFLSFNKSLQTVNFKTNSIDDLKILINVLNSTKKDNLKINIFINDKESQKLIKIINDLKIKKNYKLKLIYTKDYLSKNIFKQVNTTILKLILIIIIISIIIGFILYN